MLRLRRKIKSKRNRKPFQRFDEKDVGTGLSMFDWFVITALFGMFVVMIYYTIGGLFFWGK